MAHKGKFRMVKHHAGQNHRNAKQGGHGKGKGKRLIKTAHKKGKR
jgi:hypothetical protein